MRLRELERADWPRVLELNTPSVRELSELDEQRLEYLCSLAVSHPEKLVALLGGELAPAA